MLLKGSRVAQLESKRTHVLGVAESSRSFTHKGGSNSQRGNIRQKEMLSRGFEDRQEQLDGVVRAG